MKLSTKSEYACLALIELSKEYGKHVLRTEDIASRGHIPKKYLEQILLMLKRGGYVISHRGSKGGYELAREPVKITVAEVVRIMDGALAPTASVSSYFYARTPIEGNAALAGLFRDIRDLVAARMESTTFEDLTRD